MNSLLSSAILIALPFASLFGEIKSQILYAQKSNDVKRAFSLYLKHFSENHDFQLLESLATGLLSSGIKSPDIETELLTMYGASLANLHCPLYILESGIVSSNPYVQAAAIRTLATMQEDGTDQVLMMAMKSPYLMIRIQAAHALSSRGHKNALGSIESLMRKLPQEAWVFFPDFYARLGTKPATSLLKTLMRSPHTQVRLSAIYSAAKYKRDELLPTIRAMATHIDYNEQEMAAFALGTFHDMGSKERLLELAQCKDSGVALAAAFALLSIGDTLGRDIICQHAEKENPFAIALMGHFEEGKTLLHKLMKSEQMTTRLNTTLTLLKRKDPYAIKGLGEFLFQTPSDLGFHPVSSKGYALRSWRPFPSLSGRPKEERLELAAISQALREEMLVESLELEESYFLLIAKKIFDRGEYNLIPVLVNLLENIDSPAALRLLQDESKRTGAPLTRAYCNLALYRSGAPHFDEKPFFAWIDKEKNHHMIQFKMEGSTKKNKEPASIYSLTPEETSRLLVESFTALASRQDPQSIEVLLRAIAHGHPKNRPVLAGLLLLAIQ